MSERKKMTEEERRKAHSIASTLSNKKYRTLISFRLHNVRDADILEHLAKQDNKMGYIKRIIREDIARQKEE